MGKGYAKKKKRKPCIRIEYQNTNESNTNCAKSQLQQQNGKTNKVWGIHDIRE